LTFIKITFLSFFSADVYAEFKKNTDILENAYGDMQDIEFTIQEGKLFMLQTRNGKRGGEAASRLLWISSNKDLSTRRARL
jgi:pyruvate,orthophosphate dikinase